MGGLGGFVGRQPEMATLRGALDEALAGSGRLIMLTGDPGMGKTRLAEELASVARQQEARVLWARCWDGAGAYWPWTQVLVSLAATADPGDLAHSLGPGAHQLARLIPECGVLPAHQAAAAAVDADHGRFLLFDAVVRLLRLSAAHQPLVLVVDDMHAGDPSSLLLVDFVSRHLRDMAVLVLVAYREDEASSSPTGDILNRLDASADRLRLGGLDAAEAAALVAEVSGRPAGRERVERVQAVAEGNPFVIQEMASLHSRPGGARPGDGPIPEPVRQMVARRLNPVSADARLLLSLAAVVGRVFDMTTLAPANTASTEGIMAGLAEAEASGLIVEEVPGGGRYRFNHAFVREAIYAAISPLDRARLHRSVAESIESRGVTDAHLALLAHHYAAAGPSDRSTRAKAFDYSRRAGRQALVTHAYPEAAAHLLRAVSLIDTASAGAAADRCQLLVELGEARARAGDAAGAEETFAETLGLARQSGCEEQFARAALGLAGDVPAPGIVDESRIMLIKEARRRIGPSDDALQARLTARLAMELYFTNELERRDSLSAEALDRARASGDFGALAAALSARHYSLFGPHDLEGRLAVATKMLAVAMDAGDVEWALTAHWWRVSDLLEGGDIVEFDRELAVWSRLAEDLRQPQHLWGPAMVRAARANLAGRVEDCERLAYEAQAIGQETVAESAMTYFSAQFFSVRRWQGRLGELEEVVAGLAESMPQVPLWRCALAYLFAELERPVEARRELDHFADRAFLPLPRDAGWFMAISLLADVCGYLGDAERAALLYDLMAPYEDRVIVAGFAGVSHGSAARCLGVLAATMGHFDVAGRHFEAALDLNRRLGASAWLAHTRVDYADMLMARAEPGDGERARQLLDDAATEFGRLGLACFEALASARLDRVRPAVVETDIALAAASISGGAPQSQMVARTRLADVIELPTGGPRGGDRAGRVEVVERGVSAGSTGSIQASLRRHGDYWTLRYRSGTFRLRDARGLHYLALLLGRPGREVPCLELVSAVEGQTPESGRRGPSRASMSDLAATRGRSSTPRPWPPTAVASSILLTTWRRLDASLIPRAPPGPSARSTS